MSVYMNFSVVIKIAYIFETNYISTKLDTIFFQIPNQQKRLIVFHLQLFDSSQIIFI